MVSGRIKRFDFKTAVVALFCVLGAGFGGYCLYEDFNQSGGAGQGVPMAKVERREAKVRRKAASSFAWNNVQTEEKLFRKDSVQTSVGSAAAVRFNDGTLIELGENSLVVIDDIQNLSLDFVKGSVVLHTAEGDKRVTVGKDGKAKFEELPIRLVKPEPLGRFFTQGQELKPVHFVWKARPSQESALPREFAVQVSPDRSFRGTRVQSVVIKDAKSFEAELTLPAGNYFWRLAAADKALTDISQFRVIPAAPLKPVSPAGGEKLVSYGEQVPVQFHWLSPDEALAPGQVEHELQISTDPAFRSIVARDAIEGTKGLATLKDLPEGSLYWRIQSRYPDIVVVSPAEHFATGRAQRPTLALTLPEDKKTVERMSQLHLSWSSDSEGLEYVLELKGTQGKEVLRQKTLSTGYTWKNPEPGPYQWRVTALHKDKAVGETPWHTFSVFEGSRIVLRAPAQAQEIYYWEKPTPFAFKWDPDELLSRQPGYSYQVQVSREADFKSSMSGPKTREPLLPAEKLSLDGGSYFWKVLVVDENGQTIKTSEASRFAYGVFPPLPAPQAAGPEPRAVFNLVEKEQNPVATWNEVKDAEAYEVVLYAVDPGRATASAVAPGAPPPGGRVVFQTVTSKTSIELKGLKAAEYAWSVRAIDRIKRKGQVMQPRPFSITYGEVLSSPQVVSPEVQ